MKKSSAQTLFWLQKLSMFVSDFEVMCFFNFVTSGIKHMNRKYQKTTLVTFKNGSKQKHPENHHETINQPPTSQLGCIKAYPIFNQFSNLPVPSPWSKIVWMETFGLCSPDVPWSKVAFIGDGHPTFNRNPYNGYINPYYWVDDHLLLYGNNGSLDPGADQFYCISVASRSQRHFQPCCGIIVGLWTFEPTTIEVWLHCIASFILPTAPQVLAGTNRRI